MQLSNEGKCVEESWKFIPSITDYAEIDSFVIMPDHVHGILVINNPDEPRELRTNEFKMQKRSLSNVIRNFKSASTTKIRRMKRDDNFIVWQPRFYDRIIWNEKELKAVRNYIANNPKKWEEDGKGARQ